MIKISIDIYDTNTVFIRKENPIDPILYSWVTITDEEFIELYNWMRENRPNAMPKVQEVDRFTILDHEV